MLNGEKLASKSWIMVIILILFFMVNWLPFNLATTTCGTSCHFTYDCYGIHDASRIVDYKLERSDITYVRKKFGK